MSDDPIVYRKKKRVVVVGNEEPPIPSAPVSSNPVLEKKSTLSLKNKSTIQVQPGSRYAVERISIQARPTAQPTYTQPTNKPNKPNKFGKQLQKAKPQKPVKVKIPPPKKLTANERKKRNLEKAKATMQVLAEQFPALFAQVLPMAIGVQKVLNTERKEGRLKVGCENLQLGLEYWSLRNSYLEAIKQGGPRYNLNGEIEGEITAQHIEHATKELERRAKIKASYEARKLAAQKPQN